MIPKIIHQIWVGDNQKMPKEWMDTWRRQNPTWQYWFWGNFHLSALDWECRKQLDKYIEAECWAGVADVMRYEILYRFGGVFTDADSEALKPIPDEWLESGTFAAWESETHREGLVANGFIGSEPNSPILREMIDAIKRMENPLRRGRKLCKAWESTGPKLITTAAFSAVPTIRRILPSKSVYPTHFLDTEPQDESESIARQHWGTTKGIY